MIKQEKLEELIRERIPLKWTSTGWHIARCPLCNDYKPRGGFKFENNSVIYSCFNCGEASVYEEFGEKISKKMRRILNLFGVEDSDISNVVNSSFFNRKQEEPTKITLDRLTKIDTSTPKVALPKDCKRLGMGDAANEVDLQMKIINYLQGRCIDFESYPFFYSTQDRFKDRVIIPYYRNGEVIFWQARALDDANKKRYDNAPVGREAVMFNMDSLYRYSNAPLFVCEGVFDALMFNGLALAGSKLTPAKFELLKQSRRRLVFVIDKDKNGRHLAETVMNAGWEITFAPDGAEDINKSVQRFGKAYAAQQLMKNIPMNRVAADLALGLNCV